MQIKISLWGGKRFTIEAEPGLTGYEIVEQFIEHGLIEPLNNHSIALLFYDKHRQELNMELSLCENGVEEHDVLLLVKFPNGCG